MENNKFQYKNITIGCDPEFLIKSKRGKLISSIGIIGGTKWDPLFIPELGNGYAIQKDNVLGEFNVPHASSAHQLASNVDVMKAYITGFLYANELYPEYSASGIYKADQLRDPEALEFGCDPDFNAWTEEQNEKPDPINKGLRSAGK